MSDLLPFLLLAVLLSVTPGPDAVLVLRSSVLLTHTRGRQPNPTFAQVTDGGPPPRSGMRRAFGAGLLSDLLNPKVGLFSIAIVPQFVPPGASVLQYSLLLTGIEIAVALLWLVLLAWIATLLCSGCAAPLSTAGCNAPWACRWSGSGRP